VAREAAALARAAIELGTGVSLEPRPPDPRDPGPYGAGAPSVLRFHYAGTDPIPSVRPPVRVVVIRPAQGPEPEADQPINGHHCPTDDGDDTE
jgi:hypothetical protein